MEEYFSQLAKAVQFVDGRYLVNVSASDGSLKQFYFKTAREAAVFIAGVNGNFVRAYV